MNCTTNFINTQSEDGGVTNRFLTYNYVIITVIHTEVYEFFYWILIKVSLAINSAMKKIRVQREKKRN